MSKFNFVNFFKNLDRNVLLVGIAVVAIVIVGVLILTSGSSGQFLDKIKNFGGASKDDLAKKAIDYINKNILSGQTAVLNSVSEESGLIKINFKIGENTFDSYVTKDGKLLFPETIKIEEGTNKATDDSTARQSAKTCDDLTKADKPELDAYVVSQCPFGLQMQRVLADVVNSASSLAQNIKVKYIGSISNGTIASMHGDVEAQENLKQICIRDEQASKYWKYVSCYIKAGDTDGCLTSTGIDKTKLNNCISDKNRGLAYAQEDFNLAAKYNNTPECKANPNNCAVAGSPALILNGQQVSEFDFGGRTSEAVKSLICCGSKTQSSVCSQTLNTASAASSFSKTYAGSVNNSGSASCGQ